MQNPVKSVAYEPEDLLTDRIETVIFTATTNCNLRCTYCGVSLPTYKGKDFDFSKIAGIAEQMANASVRAVQINGHGETTMLPGWANYCRQFLDRGIKVAITSNFSFLYSAEEVDVLSRMQWITVSIDTVDRELLKRVRRKVDLRTIIYNMQAIRLRAVSVYDHYPVFNWQCTLTDQVVDGLRDWVQMGILNGVEHFTLGNLIEHTELADVLGKDGVRVPRHIAFLGKDELVAACHSIADARRLAYEGGGDMTIQPGIAEGVNARLAQLGINRMVDFSNPSTLP